MHEPASWSVDPAAVLAATALFGALDSEALEKLAAQVERVHVVGGATLMSEGEPGDCLYVVASGRLAVLVKGADGAEVSVAEIARGETVGEMALLSGSPRSATVRALRDSLLLRFSKASFDLMLEHHPRTTMQLARLIVLRLEQSIHMQRDATAAPATIAVAPSGGNAPVTLVARLLAEQLDRHGPTLHLTSGRLESDLGATAGDDATVTAWLDQQEAEHEFVVYECDAEPTAWTLRCLRQADRIALAARASESEAHSEVEARLFDGHGERTRVPTELVLVHPPDTRMPDRAEVWRRTRPVAAHHHIREGRATDAERLGRLVLGRGIGVVLSGGAARGFAHLGVLRALEECGVPIDAVGGTSMGAILGGLVACGYSHEERMERARTGFFENPPDKDFTLPIVAINHGGRSNTMLRGMYGDALIENLWTPYFCASTNLTRAELLVSRDGPLWRWVRASCSAPGMAPPIFEDGQLIVDGGILDNLPVAVMRRTHGIGTTIASDAGSARDAWRALPPWDGVSGWAVLWQRLSDRRGARGASGVPSLADILMLTSTISSVPAGLEARRLADLYLSPPTSGVRLTEWTAIDRAAEEGYRYAIERVRQWGEKS
jgi:predicted acylesterase/phospholipase RssA/CRP-like cAMP-binding protein